MEWKFCHLMKTGHSKLECPDGCLVGRFKHLEESLRTARPARVLPRDPAQTELSISELVEMEFWLAVRRASRKQEQSKTYYYY